MIAIDRGPLFPLGDIVITANAAATLPRHDVEAALRRHVRGDWGELGQQDKSENQRGLERGCRLCSTYHASNGVKFWIITEPDRSRTTILLPEDY